MLVASTPDRTVSVAWQALAWPVGPAQAQAAGCVRATAQGPTSALTPGQVASQYLPV